MRSRLPSRVTIGSSNSASAAAQNSRRAAKPHEFFWNHRRLYQATPMIGQDNVLGLAHGGDET
jgi:hypothetical protein